MPRGHFWFRVVTLLVLAGGTAGLTALAAGDTSIKSQGAYTGSQSCRECHEKFYQLWAPSHHGKAMQAYSNDFARQNLTPQKKALSIKGRSYQAQVGPGQGWILEKDKAGQKRLPIKHALGGKNIFYFLTPLAKGRLQTLPLAYDIAQKKWFDTAKSGIRHAGDAPVDWRDASYTFNTSCHGCHVSQFALNYDLKTGEYHTTWQEPGINCETCHGPGQAHIKVCQQAPKGTVPTDLRMIRGGRDFTNEQNNATCSSCHAKAIPLTTSFKPGEKFWDHYDLATLEHPDYYPDGRDLGENYTYTSWLMSPCVKAGQINCLHCHTSSGRFRQAKDPNTACLPCHEKRVKNAPAHIRHQPGDMSPTCVSCHMPKTSFARMHRSDHSMLPPTPAASLKYGSPNACNNCHQDRGAAWADEMVRSWRKRDYQMPVLHRAGLIEAARQRDWSRLPEMAAYLGSPGRDEIFAASLLRLLRACPEPLKWQAVIKAAKDPSPLVRSAALESLQEHLSSPAAATTLLAALDDPYRLVRIRSAGALAGFPDQGLGKADRLRLLAATKEMIQSLLARPDTWSAHYNVGNFYLDRGMLKQAAFAYQAALDIAPRAVMPLVNLAMAHARAGDNATAEKYLRRALKQEPDNAAANFNLGLLLAEQGQKPQAEKYLRAALKAEPKMARAAYNLGLLLSQQSPSKGVDLLSLAYALQPGPRYAYTLAYFMKQAGQQQAAIKLLRQAVGSWPHHIDSALLLSSIYRQQGKAKQAQEVLQNTLKRAPLSPRQMRRIQAELKKMG